MKAIPAIDNNHPDSILLDEVMKRINDNYRPENVTQSRFSPISRENVVARV